MKQSFDFGRGKGAALSAGESSQTDRADGDPGQPFDVETEIRGHPADFPVFPLGKDEIIVSRSGRTDFPGAQPVAFGRHSRSGQLPDRFFRQFAGEGNAIGFFHLVTGMRQTGHEIAVVGKEDQPFTVLVQPSGGNQPRFPCLRNEIDRFLFGMTVLQRADVAARLVQHDVKFLPGRCDGPAVEFHPVAGPDPHGTAFGGQTVDFDPPGDNQRFGAAAGTDSRRAQIFGQRNIVRVHHEPAPGSAVLNPDFGFFGFGPVRLYRCRRCGRSG